MFLTVERHEGRGAIKLLVFMTRYTTPYIKCLEEASAILTLPPHSPPSPTHRLPHSMKLVGHIILTSIETVKGLHS